MPGEGDRPRPQRLKLKGSHFNKLSVREDLVMTTLAKGIIIGVVAVAFLVVLVFGIVIATSVVGWRAAQRAGNEAATLQHLKTIEAVEIQYYNTHNRTFGAFDQMVKEGMLTNRFSGEFPIVDGYVFTLTLIPRTANRTASYTLRADPQTERTGKNHFYIDSNGGDIHVNADQPAKATDPLLGE